MEASGSHSLGPAASSAQHTPVLPLTDPTQGAFFFLNKHGKHKLPVSPLGSPQMDWRVSQEAGPRGQSSEVRGWPSTVGHTWQSQLHGLRQEDTKPEARLGSLKRPWPQAKNETCWGCSSGQSTCLAHTKTGFNAQYQEVYREERSPWISRVRAIGGLVLLEEASGLGWRTQLSHCPAEPFLRCPSAQRASASPSSLPASQRRNPPASFLALILQSARIHC